MKGSEQCEVNDDFLFKSCAMVKLSVATFHSGSPHCSLLSLTKVFFCAVKQIGKKARLTWSQNFPQQISSATTKETPVWHDSWVSFFLLSQNNVDPKLILEKFFVWDSCLVFGIIFFCEIVFASTTFFKCKGRQQTEVCGSNNQCCALVFVRNL